MLCSSMGDPNPLATPLLSPTRTVSPKTSDHSITLRIAFLFLIGALAVWATCEDSKGFRISVVNDLPPDSRASQRFELFYVSNGLAERVLLNASDFVQSLLRDQNRPVSHVTLRISGDDFPGGVSVVSGEARGELVVDLSHKLMDAHAPDADVAFRSAVLRGMARVWVADDGVIPVEIVSGVVEYIAIAAGFGGKDRLEAIRCGGDYRGDRHDWFVEKDPRFVVSLLARCEEEESGFIGRLNAAMIRDGWHDRTVEDALGKPASVCLCVPDN